MIGCTAGSSQLDGPDEETRRTTARCLAATLQAQARTLNAQLIVLKEFPASDRAALGCLRDHGYQRIASLPAVRLDIAYGTFEDYMRAALSRNARTHVRRALRASDGPPAIELQIVKDIRPFIDEAYPLYEQVFHRSEIFLREAHPAVLLRAEAPRAGEGAVLPLATARPTGRVQLLHVRARYVPR